MEKSQSPIPPAGGFSFAGKRSNVDSVPLIRHGLRRATFPQGKAFSADKKGDGLAPVSPFGIRCLCRSADYCSSCSTPWGTWLA